MWDPAPYVVYDISSMTRVLQDLYPLTLALEKEGAAGAELQKLQLAQHMQLMSRAADPPMPQKSKASRTRPQRRWHQE